MFDGVFIDLTDRRWDDQQVAGTLPWQFVILLLCFATLAVVAAVLYPDVFGAPLEQF